MSGAPELGRDHAAREPTLPGPFLCGGPGTGAAQEHALYGGFNPPRQSCKLGRGHPKSGVPMSLAPRGSENPKGGPKVPPGARLLPAARSGTSRTWVSCVQRGGPHSVLRVCSREPGTQPSPLWATRGRGGAARSLLRPGLGGAGRGPFLLTLGTRRRPLGGRQNQDRPAESHGVVAWRAHAGSGAAGRGDGWAVGGGRLTLGFVPSHWVEGSATY